MSFKINWPDFSPDLVGRLRGAIESALKLYTSNKGTQSGGRRPSGYDPIPGDIFVLDVDLGSRPPEIELVEVSELTAEKKVLKMRVCYEGDAKLLLETSLQVNPLFSRSLFSQTPQSSIASNPLLLPLKVTIGELRLAGTFTLSLTPASCHVSFHEDPIRGIRVKSSLDQIALVREALQKDIEASLRKIVALDLPAWNLMAFSADNPVDLTAQADRKKAASLPLLATGSRHRNSDLGLSASASSPLTLVRHHSVQSWTPTTTTTSSSRDPATSPRRQSSPAASPQHQQQQQQSFRTVQSGDNFGSMSGLESFRSVPALRATKLQSLTSPLMSSRHSLLLSPIINRMMRRSNPHHHSHHQRRRIESAQSFQLHNQPRFRQRAHSTDEPLHSCSEDDVD